MKLSSFPLSAILLVILACSPVLGKDAQVDLRQLTSTELSLEGQQKAAAQLGLKGKAAFALKDLESEIIIVELFSMYCPHCQREAPNVNKLYSTIKNNKDTKDKVLLMGVGAGNTPYEVKIFKKKYSVEFPLVADPRIEMGKALKEPLRTPTFIVLKRNNNGDFEVLDIKLGGLGKLSDFMAQVEAGIK
jgi:thiol-disulfide isomerase/thioredoxin